MIIDSSRKFSLILPYLSNAFHNYVLECEYCCTVGRSQAGSGAMRDVLLEYVG